MKRIKSILVAVCLMFAVFTGYINRTSVLLGHEKPEITKPKIIFKENQSPIKKSAVFPDETEQTITALDSKTDENINIQVQYNEITIPDVCTNARLSIGSTQEAVDNSDICIMTEANNSNFGDSKLRPILLGGHNTKSLKYLYSAHINDVITVCYNNNQYEYKITYSNECTNDGYKLYDIDTGINMLDYSLNQEVLYIYTCYGSNNWLVKAVRV